MDSVFSEDLFTNKLTDIISVGFCDDFKNGEILEYTANMDILYLDMECFLLRLESVKQYSQLLIKRDREICYEYIIDEDMKYAFAKLHNIVFELGEMADVYIKKILLYNLHIKKHDFILCDAMKIYLSSDKVLFFDPANYFGINIGQETAEKIWEEQNKYYTVTIIDYKTVKDFF